MAKKIVNEKVKPIVVTHKETGEQYTLEFSRESVRFAEMRGFNPDDVSRFPMLKIPELWFYAFRMHHKNVSRERTDMFLFEEIGGIPDGLLERLLALYAAPFEVLSTENENGETKNATMTVEF